MRSITAETVLLDLLPLGVVAVDNAGLIVYANGRATDLLAQPDLTGRPVTELLGAPGEDDPETLLARVLAGTTWTGDRSMVRADGSALQVRLTASPVPNAGAVLVLDDVTALRGLERLAADHERRLRLALAAADLGTWHWDMVAGTTTWDGQLERIFGLEPGGFDGRFETWVALLHPDDRDEVLDSVQRALAARGSYDVLHRAVWPDGSVHWIEGRGQVTVDRAGEVTGTIGCSRDVTARVEAQQRAGVVQEMTARLASALTVEQIAGAVSEQSTALGGDAVALVVLEQGGHLLRMIPAVGSVRTVPPVLAVDERFPVVDAITRREPVVLTEDELVNRYPDRPVHGPGAVVCLPLLAGGATLGALVLELDEERALGGLDRVLLDTLAGQCAIAVDRALLLSRSRAIADQLQRDLAPESLPVIAGLELAAVYEPGGDELEQVGGDWYDAIPLDDGGVLLVVGDVMGRGVPAAATMTRVRAAVRAFSAVDPQPAVVAAKADRLVARDCPDELVTVVLARVDPAAGTVAVCSAGHLPLLVIDRAGPARLLRPRPGVPLGLASSRDDDTYELASGAALCLVTDGVVERRGQDLDAGLEWLRATGERLAGRPLPELVAALAERAAPSDDDVTLLAARLG